MLHTHVFTVVYRPAFGKNTLCLYWPAIQQRNVYGYSLKKINSMGNR